MSNPLTVIPYNSGATGTVDTVKSGAVSAAEWLCRQVTVVKDVVVSTVAKIIAFIRPLFSNAGTYLRNAGVYFGKVFQSLGTWASTHRDAALALGVGGALASTAAIVLCVLKNKDDKPED